MWSPSKYSPFDTIHLSHLCFHCWKHSWNSASLKPFSSDVISLLIVVTSPKFCPRSTNLHLGNHRSTIHHLWWPFPRIHRFPLRFLSRCNTPSVANFAQEWAVSVTILAQTFFMSKYSIKIVWTDDFPKPSSSAIIQTFNQRSLSTRECTRSMFSLPLEVEGHPDLALSLGSSRPSWKRWTHLKTVLSFRAHTP